VGNHQPGIPCPFTKVKREVVNVPELLFYAYIFLTCLNTGVILMTCLCYISHIQCYWFWFCTEALNFPCFISGTICFNCTQKLICAVHKPQHAFVIMIHCYKRWWQNINLPKNSSV
jgi:hypothetical protein